MVNVDGSLIDEEKYLRRIHNGKSRNTGQHVSGTRGTVQ